MIEKLRNERRLLVEADLRPVQGDRFQPTGFADIGAATYQLPDGTRMLLVESAQSMANRLEATIVGPDGEIISELAGLPYIKVKLTGATDTATSSLTEAHRTNSPFIITDEDFKERFKTDAEYSKHKPVNWQKVARALFKYDVNALIHGVFMANLEDGRLKVPRALTGFIEARGVREAVSGGTKFNAMDPSGKIRVTGFDKDVYGNVPFHRIEFTAEAISAYFNLDLGMLRSYALGDDAFSLAVLLCLFKIRAFLDGGLRLRTACDLRLAGDPKVTEPVGFELQSKDALLKELKEAIVKAKGMFADPPVTELTAGTIKKGEEAEETSVGEEPGEVPESEE